MVMANGKVHSSLVVRPYRPWRLWVVLLGLPLLLAGVAKVAFEYGVVQAGHDLASLETREVELKARIADLEALGARLREEKVMLERSAQVDRRAHEEVRGNLDTLQDEISELREELAFYRSIVSPGDVKPGLRVQDFLLFPGGESLYRYRLVLTQVLNNERFAEGRVALTMEGFQGGEARRIDFSELGGGRDLRFRFKYFQNIEGDIRLPEGFVPSRIVVEVTQRVKKKAETIERTFDWPSAATSALPRSPERIDG